MKKNILSKIITIGVITTPILVGTSLIANSNTIINNSNSLITNLDIEKKKLLPPTTSSTITPEFVTQLVAYKTSLVEIGSTWDGILVEDDFKNRNEPEISVEADAFKNQITITSITFPTTVTSINANAFSGATNLKTISALGVSWINEGAFNGITGIDAGGIKLTFKSGVNAIKLGNVTRWGTTIEKVDIKGHPTKPRNTIIDPNFINNLIEYKESLIAGDTFPKLDLLADDFPLATEITINAFLNITKIKSITLPQTVRKIGANAFSGSSNLEYISALGATDIGINAFKSIRFIEKGLKLTASANITVDNAELWGTTPNNLDIIQATLPTIGTDGIITPEFIAKLVTYKISLSTITPWDGSLIETDFTGGTNVPAEAFMSINEITSITFPTTVTSIGANAFSWLRNLKTVTALGVTSIGDKAFQGAGIAIKGIKLSTSANISVDKAELWGTYWNKLDIIWATPDSLPIVDANGIITFEFVNKLITYKESIVEIGSIWNGVLVENDFVGATSVASNAFQKNTEITSITLPDTVKIINTNSFAVATSLKTISALGVDSIADGAFNGTRWLDIGGIKLTASANISVDKAEIWGTTPEKLDIKPITVKPPKVPANGIITLEFINELITYKNSMLTPGDIWNGILFENDFVGATSIAANAFQDKTTITSITLPISVTSINTNAFSGATNLKTISALGVTDISDGAFNGITGLDPNGIKLTGSANITLDKAVIWGTTADKLDIKPIVVNPPKVPANGIITPEFVNELITYKNSLSRTRIPWDGSLLETDFVGATSIAANAFQDKTTITSITLPNTVTSIGANAFNGANGLKTISALGATSIGANAFVGTTSIVVKGIKLTESATITADKFADWGLADGTSLDITPTTVVPPIPPTTTPGFFDDVNNIYMIAGIGAGVLLLIAGGLTGFLLYRKNANESDFSKDKKEKIVKKEKDSKNKESKDKDSKKEKDKKDKSKDKDSKKEKDKKDKSEDENNKSIKDEHLDDKDKSIKDEHLDDKEQIIEENDQSNIEIIEDKKNESSNEKNIDDIEIENIED